MNLPGVFPIAFNWCKWMSSDGIIVWGLLDSQGQSSYGRIITTAMCISDTLTVEEHMQAEGWSCKLCAGKSAPTREPCWDPQPSSGVTRGWPQPCSLCFLPLGCWGLCRKLAEHCNCCTMRAAAVFGLFIFFPLLLFLPFSLQIFL